MTPEARKKLMDRLAEISKEQGELGSRLDEVFAEAKDVSKKINNLNRELLAAWRAAVGRGENVS